MNGVQFLLHKAGVSPYYWKWVPDDFGAAWAAWNSAPEMVQLLGSVFPWERVAAPLQALAAAAPALELSKELKHRNVVCLYNVAAILTSPFGGRVPDSLIVDVYKSQFPLAEVAGAVCKLLS